MHSKKNKNQDSGSHSKLLEESSGVIPVSSHENTETKNVSTYVLFLCIVSTVCWYCYVCCVAFRSDVQYSVLKLKTRNYILPAPDFLFKLKNPI